MEIKNIGESICIIGVLAVVGLTGNYWLLFFTGFPLFTWMGIDSKVKEKVNGFCWRKQELEIEKLQEELRLLKLKKK